MTNPAIGAWARHGTMDRSCWRPSPYSGRGRHPLDADVARSLGAFARRSLSTMVRRDLALEAPPSDVNSDAISLLLVPVMTATFAREFVSVSVLRCDHGCDRLVDMRLRAGRHCIGQHHRWRAGPFAQFIEGLL